MIKRGLYFLLSFIIVCSCSFTYLSKEVDAATTESRVYKSVQDFVKDFNSQELSGMYFHIDSYNVKTYNGVRRFNAKLNLGEEFSLSGIVNKDNSLRSITFQSKVYYATELDPDIEGGTGDLGLERIMMAYSLIQTLNPESKWELVSGKVLSMIKKVPLIDPGKGKKTISSKVKVNGLTYSVYLPKNSDVFTLKVSK